jgi:nitroreductase
MSEAEINALLELALLSPTSFNIQNWRFVVVTDSEKRAAIQAAAWNQAQITEASITILLCADLHAHEDAGRYWVNAPQLVQDMLVPMLAPFYGTNPQLQRDEAMRSVGIAAQTLMLAAKALGYDSCPMEGFDECRVRRLLNLPKKGLVTMILAAGKRSEKGVYNRQYRFDKSELVHYL